jgi:hypothetical protein
MVPAVSAFAANRQTGNNFNPAAPQKFYLLQSF